MPRSITFGAALALLFLTGCPEPSGTPEPFDFENTGSDAGAVDTEPSSDTSDADAGDALEDCSRSFVEETESLLEDEPAPGFGRDTPDGLPDTLTLSEVEPDRLVLQDPRLSTPAVFHWRGPDLTEYFVEGESVTADPSGHQHSVEGTSHMAVASPGFSAFNFPVLRLRNQQDPLTVNSRSPCGAGTDRYGVVKRAYRALVAQHGSTAVTIPVGETETIDGWTITFLGATLLPGENRMEGDTVVSVDPSARLRATALGPAGGNQ